MSNGNRWHADQENNLRPNENFLPCPWCGSNSISVDSLLTVLKDHGNYWSARSSCHECGATSPEASFPSWKHHPLYEDYLYTDKSNEREVVNLAVKVWNCRK